MLVLLFSFIFSWVMIKVILYTDRVHARLTADHDLDSIQKMHTHPVPRIGGLAIFISMIFSALFATNYHMEWSGYYAGLVVAVFFVFLGGFIEDLTKSISPCKRMSFMLASIMVAAFITHSLPLIQHSLVPSFDQALTFIFFAILITSIAVVGLSNAYNIIDGYNGLSTAAALLNLIAIASIALKIGDMNLTFVSLSVVGAVIGFLCFNYPRGKIFLGDGGAYLLGFVVAVLSLTLTESHPTLVSPYCVLLLAIYPVTEMGFSMIRRKFIHKTKSMQPDNMHLHQLVYDRCIPSRLESRRNSLVMPIMLFFILPQTFIGVFFYENHTVILSSIALYVVYYVIMYFKLATFKTPKFMIMR